MVKSKINEKDKFGEGGWKSLKISMQVDFLPILLLTQNQCLQILNPKDKQMCKVPTEMRKIAHFNFSSITPQGKEKWGKLVLTSNVQEDPSVKSRKQ